MDEEALNKAKPQSWQHLQTQPALPPLPNYSLSTRCPACETPTYKLACKVRCPKCGFMWDCSEL